MKTTLSAAVLLLAAAVTLAQTSVPRSAAPPMNPDGASVDAILNALYESVSHPDGAEPNWSRMRGIFLPVGMLIPPKRPNEDMFTVLDVDQFRERVQKAQAAAKQQKTMG